VHEVFALEYKEELIDRDRTFLSAVDLIGVPFLRIEFTNRLIEPILADFTGLIKVTVLWTRGSITYEALPVVDILFEASIVKSMPLLSSLGI